MRKFLKLSKFSLALISLLLICQPLFSLPNTFVLKATIALKSTGLINGSYPVTFKIYDSSNNLLWQESKDAVDFTAGRFETELGTSTALSYSILNRDNILIGVNIQGNEAIVRVTATPYALIAKDALTAYSVTGNAGGDLSGNYANLTVAKLRGKNISTTAPTDGQVLKWNNTNSVWEPGTDAIGNGSSGGTTYTAGTGISIADGVVTNTGLLTTSTASGDLSGTYLSPTVTKLQGKSISTTAPTNGQVLKWNNTNSAWEPTTDTTGTAYTAGAGISIASGLITNTGLATTNASGDLSGTYPSPTVTKLQGSAISSTAPNTNQILKWSGTSWTPSTITKEIFIPASNGGTTAYNNFNIPLLVTSVYMTFYMPADFVSLTELVFVMVPTGGANNIKFTPSSGDKNGNATVAAENTKNFATNDGIITELDLSDIITPVASRYYGLKITKLTGSINCLGIRLKYIASY